MLAGLMGLGFISDPVVSSPRVAPQINQTAASSTDRRETINERDAENIFLSHVEDDFLAALRNKDALLKKEQWFRILGLSGQTNANTILIDFKANEVSAARKYQGSWLITGQVTGINDSFGQAIVEMGAVSSFINFNAGFDNKDRVATYQMGEAITVFCGRISESLSVIHGHECMDYRDWAFPNLKTAIANLPSDTLGRGGSPVDKIFGLMRISIFSLPKDTDCLSNFRSELCQKQIQEAGKPYAASMLSKQ